MYALIKDIRNEQEMPKGWEEGKIVTIHKKRDRRDCKKYRGATLPSTDYKVLSTLIQTRLVHNAKKI